MVQLKLCKAGILLVVILLIIAGCNKNKQYQDCTSCSYVNKDSISYQETAIDSATFYQAILGTWYIKEFDTFLSQKCRTQCFCDTSYTVSFLNKGTFVINFPYGERDTFAYFFKPSYNNQISATDGHFQLPGRPGYLAYSNNYVLIYTQTQSLDVSYAANYYLTRH